ncbi:MAG: error-prone DNA polymerase, partial [Candidatus Dormibacteraeota bacterium]|nr:error-prone DNA polymerase [Candidatus Dormibacteraeota bacterium]
PKSHAAAFGLLAYQSTWLKVHHPSEFFCALYNNWPMGFYPPHVFTNDARRHGVRVLGPNVNVSLASCTVESPPSPQPSPRRGEGVLGEGVVRIGLGYVHGLGKAGADAVVEARADAGPFRSLFDFMHRTGLRTEAVENLVRVGAFSDLGLNRRELLWQLGLFGGGLQRGWLSRPPKARQLRLGLPTSQDEVQLPDFSAYERMAADYEVLKLSPDSHPMAFQRPWLDTLGVASSLSLQLTQTQRRVETAGLVVCRQRPGTAKGIVFLLLEDEHGMTNVLIPAQLYDEQRVVVRSCDFLWVGGVLEGHAGAVPMLRAERVARLRDQAEPLRTPQGKSWG